MHPKNCLPKKVKSIKIKLKKKKTKKSTKFLKKLKKNIYIKVQNHFDFYQSLYTNVYNC